MNQYCIIRTAQAGVFAGYVKERDGQEAVLTDVRRLWRWDGAASLSQLATEGVSKPQSCKFTVIVAEMTVLGVIEIIPCTKQAEQSVKGVSVWRA